MTSCIKTTHHDTVGVLSLKKNTYLLIKGKYYEQLHVAAKGLPISPIVAILFKEQFEIKAINFTTHPPSLLFRYVDDTFVIQKVE